MIAIEAPHKPGVTSKTISLINHPVVIVGLITLLGAALRFYHLGFKPLWVDEAVIYSIAHSGSLRDIIVQNSILNSAPPLYTILISLVSQLGNSEAVLRLISWAGGVASIPAIYLLADQLMGKIPAYFTTLLVAVALNQVTYSQTMREYSLAFLLATLILAFFYLQLNKPSWTNLLLMTICMIIGIFLQYGLALLILALNLVFIVELFIRKLNWKIRLARWSLSQGVVLISVVAVYFLSLNKQMVVGFGGGGIFSYLSNSYWNGSWSSLFSFAINNTHSLLEFSYPGIAFSTIVLIGVLNSLLFKPNRTASLLLFVPMALTFITGMLRLYPYQGWRQDMFLVPMIFVMAGMGFSFLSGMVKVKWLLPLAFLIILVVGVPQTASYLNDTGDENIRPIVNALEESYTSGDKIYVYYSAIYAFNYYYPYHADSMVVGTSNRGAPEGYYREIDSILKSGARVWLVFSHCYADECQLIPEHFSGHTDIKMITNARDAWLYLITLGNK